MIERLKILKEQRGRFSNGREAASCLLKDQDLRHEIEVLSRVFLGKIVSGCGDCYAEAYAKLLNLNLKIAMEKLEVKFKLRAGALLEDINDHSKTISQANITDELALHHLRLAKKLSEKAYSRVVGLFITLPENLEELLKQDPEDIDENKNPIIPLNGGVTPQYFDANAPGYVAPTEGIVRYPMAEGLPFDFLPNEGTIIEGTVKFADGTAIPAGEYATEEGLEFIVKEDGTAIIKEESDYSEEEETLISEIQNLLASGTTKTDIKAKYSQQESVGDKKLTGKLLDILIKEAALRATE